MNLALAIEELFYRYMMIPLDSSRWSELRHAYGAAADIPALLKQLESFPVSDGDNEPWSSLWSALCHQGDVYTASFAAVPHIIAVLASDPLKASFSFFQLPACIEIARVDKEFIIPEDLRLAYYDALQQLPGLVAVAAGREWDETILACTLSAIAAAKGFPSVAKVALELRSSTAEDFMEWLHDQ